MPLTGRGLRAEAVREFGTTTDTIAGQFCWQLFDRSILPVVDSRQTVGLLVFSRC
jgi:hypothetical protein